jgi:hypothetical protein
MFIIIQRRNHQPVKNWSTTESRSIELLLESDFVRPVNFDELCIP